MAAFIEESGLSAFGFFQFDQPLAGVLLPVGADDFGVELHVLAETPYFADLVEVLPDVRAVAEEAWPVWVQSWKWLA